MNAFSQSNFSGGMDLFNEDYALKETSYGLAFNIRNRTGALAPVGDKVEDTDAPIGLKQGIYAFDDYLVLFNNGAAYYKNIVNNTAWVKISDFALKVDAPYVYAEPVPASASNFARKLQAATRVDGSSSESNVDTSPTLINTSNAGLVCQDGVGQGFIILPDGSARILKNYAQWTTTNREYVPVMTRMKYHNGILFGVSTDGKTIYRSVSGRPLDFVVNITATGEKGGDASTTSYRVSYSDITCINAMSSGELLVGTSKQCFPIEFNYDKTIFAEPTFLNRRAFAAGVVNHFSFIDVLGDYCFIDFDGIRSYNAISALQNEGRTGVFSATISKAFEGIKQDVTAAVVFQNYSIFAVTTIYGNVLAIYDNTRGIWVCFDDLDITIKQFAVADQSSSPTLYAITSDKVYKLYKSPSELEAQVYFSAVTSGAANKNLRVPQVYAVFNGGTTEAVASSTQFVNNIEKDTITRDISTDENGEVDNIVFDHRQAKQGWKTQVRLKWQNEARLSMVQYVGEEITSLVSHKQKAQLIS